MGTKCLYLTSFLISDFLGTIKLRTKMMQVRRKVHVQFNKLYHTLRVLYKPSSRPSIQ